jgi:DNA (cytosine-5)-methyltransferase 1
MLIVDLFCGGGGASMGMHRAFPTARIVGVDIKPMPRYPFEFVQGEALDFLAHIDTVPDFIWASPPCHRYSQASGQQRNRGVDYPDLILPTRMLLDNMGVPYCIENVVGSPLKNPIRLCGQMFGLKVLRHRLFETNFPVLQPMHRTHTGLERGVGKDYVCVVFNAYKRMHYKDNHVDVWREAMGIPWMVRRELAEAIPPAYSEYILRQWDDGKDYHAAGHVQLLW